MKYKKHPSGMDLMRIPEPILEGYKNRCEYKFVTIDTYGKIPVPVFALLGLEHNQINIGDIDLKEYARGFLQGYSNLVPFIDTPDTRSEVVLISISEDKGFTETHGSGFVEYNDLLNDGIYQGKRYKAWEVILDTPEYFMKYFQSPTPQQPERLDQLFEFTSKYNEIMDILVSKQLIGEGTYIWKDRKKGNKAYLASLIKSLHTKGYYKGKKTPTNNTIELICRNTFKWEVSIDTIKHAKPDNFDFSFIPIASSLQ